MIGSLVFMTLGVVQASNPVPAFAGCWAGSLEYRDYSDNSRQKLPTLLRIYKPKGSETWTFRYIYDDGPKKVIQDSETVGIDWATKKYTVTSEDGKEISAYDIDASRLKPDGTGVLILLGKSTENDVPVDVRTTMKIEKSKLQITRETHPAGKPFEFRHTYSFAFVSRA